MKLYCLTMDTPDPTRPPPAKENAPKADPSAPTTEAAWLALVAEKVNSLQYGVVQIVVHDSRIVQVERTERFRLAAPLPPKSQRPLAQPFEPGG